LPVPDLVSSMQQLCPACNTLFATIKGPWKPVSGGGQREKSIDRRNITCNIA
jgi:hypothetical protein